MTFAAEEIGAADILADETASALVAVSPALSALVNAREQVRVATINLEAAQSQEAAAYAAALDAAAPLVSSIATMLGLEKPDA